MITDHVAAAQAGADIAAFSFAGYAVLRPAGNVSIWTPAFAAGANADGGTGRSIDLVFVMHLANFNVEIVVRVAATCFVNAISRRRQAHVRRMHDDRLLAGRRQRGLARRCAVNADDRATLRPCRRDVLDGWFRQGEFYRCVRGRDHGSDIVGHRNAASPRRRRLPILSDQRRSGCPMRRQTHPSVL